MTRPARRPRARRAPVHRSPPRRTHAFARFRRAARAASPLFGALLGPLLGLAARVLVAWLQAPSCGGR